MGTTGELCFRLNEFSSHLQLAFGINLALPLFRELAVIPRLPISRQVAALESLVDLRHYSDDARKIALRSRLEGVKREIVIIDDNLKGWTNSFAAIGFVFSISALAWSFYAAMDQSCIGKYLSLFLTLTHYAPLPVSIAILYMRCHSDYQPVATRLNKLKSDVLSG